MAAHIGNIVASVTVTVRQEAEVKAEALREAADDFAVIPHPYEGGVTAWLRDRADSLDWPGRADAGD